MSYQTQRRPSRGRPSRAPFNRGGSKKKFKKDYIDPSRFVRAAKPVEVQTEYVPANQFADFAINELLKGNLTRMGYKLPTPIQDQSIPHGLTGNDIVGIANTGTGKTTAFAVPLLHRLMEDENSSALILAPTRELAQQIEDECRQIGKKSGIYGALLIGGSSMGEQLRDLRKHPRIVIGTPGRVKDHIERGTLELGRFNMVVLDEVDRMLDMGFINDIRFILDLLHPDRQSFFFSATMQGKVRELMQTFLSDPVTVSVKTGDTSDNVDQNVVKYGSNDERIEKLHDLLAQTDIKAIVFDETQRSVERLYDELRDRGFRVDAIHGGKTQGQRQRALRRFKQNEVAILVATDVAARGIDVSDITHVINYSTPQSYEDYVHRIGRAGRAGRPGNALTFISRY